MFHLFRFFYCFMEKMASQSWLITVHMKLSISIHFDYLVCCEVSLSIQFFASLSFPTIIILSSVGRIFVICIFYSSQFSDEIKLKLTFYALYWKQYKVASFEYMFWAKFVITQITSSRRYFLITVKAYFWNHFLNTFLQAW